MGRQVDRSQLGWPWGMCWVLSTKWQLNVTAFAFNQDASRKEALGAGSQICCKPTVRSIVKTLPGLQLDENIFLKTERQPYHELMHNITYYV